MHTVNIIWTQQVVLIYVICATAVKEDAMNSRVSNEEHRKVRREKTQ